MHEYVCISSYSGSRERQHGQKRRQKKKRKTSFLHCRSNHTTKFKETLTLNIALKISPESKDIYTVPLKYVSPRAPGQLLLLPQLHSSLAPYLNHELLPDYLPFNKQTIPVQDTSFGWDDTQLADRALERGRPVKGS